MAFVLDRELYGGFFFITAEFGTRTFRRRFLVRSEHKGRALRYNLGERRGSCPAACEGAEAVDAADVRQAHEAVRDGGSSVEYGCEVVSGRSRPDTLCSSFYENKT